MKSDAKRGGDSSSEGGRSPRRSRSGSRSSAKSGSKSPGSKRSRSRSGSRSGAESAPGSGAEDTEKSDPTKPAPDSSQLFGDADDISEDDQDSDAGSKMEVEEKSDTEKQKKSDDEDEARVDEEGEPMEVGYADIIIFNIFYIHDCDWCTSFNISIFLFLGRRTPA